MGKPLQAQAIVGGLIADLDFVVGQQGRQARSVASRARLTELACKAFLDRSYDAVSTHEVAAEAGVAQGLVSYHFGSKEGLWQAAMDRIFGGFRNSLAGRLREVEHVSERERLEQLIRHIVHLERCYPSMMRLMIDGAGHVGNTRLAWLLDRHVRPIYAVVTHLFEDGLARGLLRPVPASHAYYILFTAGAVFQLEDEVARVAGLDAKSNEFEQAQADCLVGMLLAD